MKRGPARGVPRNHGRAQHYMTSEGHVVDVGPTIRYAPQEYVQPAPCLTPLSPAQLESWLRRLRALMSASERSPRSLLRGAGLQGLPLEQVLTAHEAEEA